jgi:hypothetical protein
MSTPLVSVVIPTFNRPQFLPRAIDSALGAAPDGDVEVIVVPNGPDISWKVVAEHYAKDERVRWQPIETAHGNVARNHGMALARGKYLRFLDDDDFLLPAAVQQVAVLEATGAEICSARIENVDRSGEPDGLLSFPDTSDFVCAAVSFSGFALPTAHLFLRPHLRNSSWDVTLATRQDYIWMLELASMREWKWVQIDKPAGVWFQHTGTRVSQESFMRERHQFVIEKLLSLYKNLSEGNRLNANRSAAIANAIWHHAHLGFPYHPVYWTRVAKLAQSICPDARPPDSFYTSGFARKFDPVYAEWALLLPRIMSKAIKRLVSRNSDTEHKRQL